MANKCDNIFYAYTEDEENKKVIIDFFKSEKVNNTPSGIEVNFISRWTFPEREMDRLYESIPNKDDLYMRCLSFEFGCDYVGYHTCSKYGWEDRL